MKFRISVLIALMFFTGRGALTAADVLTLQECIALAEKNNSDIQTVKYGQEESRLLTSDAFGDLYPAAGLSLSAGNSGADNILPFDGGSRSASLALSQNLYKPGLFSALKIVRLNELSSDLALSSKRLEISSSVSSLYYGILSSQAVIGVYKENIQVSEQNILRIRSMYELGTRTESDVLKAEVQKGTFQSDLINEEQNLRKLKRSLNVLLGREADDELVLEDDLGTSPAIPDLETGRKMMLENNPDLKRLKIAGQIDELNVNISKEAYFPTASGSYSYGSSTGLLGNGSSISLNISVPLFSRFKTRNEIQRKQIAVKKSRIGYEDARRGLEQQLADFYTQYETVLALETINETGLRSSQRDLEIVTQQYRMGRSTILDQMNAQVSVLIAQSSLVRLRHNRKILETQIFQLIGQSE